MGREEEDFKRLTRRDFLYWGGIGMAGAAMTGLPQLGYGAEKKPKYGGRLRIGERYGSSALDPHKNQDFIDYQNCTCMYNALVDMGKLPNVEMHPMLAKSWEISKNGREYIFSLVEGVKFHHGKELDSGDVKYSIERVMNPATRSPRAFSFRWIDSVNIIDKYHIKISLKEPFAPFLASLTAQTCCIIPAGSEPTGTKPAPGTGPFIFKSFVPNETSEFTRFDKYWEYDDKTGDRLPYLDAIHFRKIVDETVRFAALRAGDLDFIVTPPLNVLAKAMLEKPVPGIFMDYESVGNPWIWFNTTKPPFNDKRVRQAVAYAIDKKEVVKAVYWGLGETVNNQPFVNSSRFYIPVEDRAVNLAKAKQLLAEAGYPNGFKTEFLQYSHTVYLAACQVVMAHLKKIGIDATMQVLDRAPHVTMLQKGEYNISLTSESERYDWDDAFYMYLHSGEIGKNNVARYGNPKLDALLEEGRKTLRWEDRVPIYKQVIEIIKEDLPILYITKEVVAIAIRDYVKGYRKGFAVRVSYHGGGIKYFWLDK
jgi:peptide/nickel transport system substrate-binding protein